MLALGAFVAGTALRASPRLASMAIIGCMSGLSCFRRSVATRCRKTTGKATQAPLCPGLEGGRFDSPAAARGRSQESKDRATMPRLASLGSAWQPNLSIPSSILMLRLGCRSLLLQFLDTVAPVLLCRSSSCTPWPRIVGSRRDQTCTRCLPSRLGSARPVSPPSQINRHERQSTDTNANRRTRTRIDQHRRRGGLRHRDDDGSENDGGNDHDDAAHA